MGLSAVDLVAGGLQALDVVGSQSTWVEAGEEVGVLPVTSVAAEASLMFGRTDDRGYDRLSSDRPIDRTRYRAMNCCMA